MQNKTIEVKYTRLQHTDTVTFSDKLKLRMDMRLFSNVIAYW